jgi:hypothetical protein
LVGRGSGGGEETLELELDSEIDDVCEDKGMLEDVVDETLALVED